MPGSHRRKYSRCRTGEGMNIPAMHPVRWMLLLCLLGGAGGAIALAQTDAKAVRFRNVELRYDPSLAQECVAETVAAVRQLDRSEKPDGVAPEHVMIVFRGSYPGRERDPDALDGLPRVYVYPTKDTSNKNFDTDFPTIHKVTQDLNVYLKRRTHGGQGGIPFMPWADMGQAFIAKRKIVRFRNGRGVLFLTQYGQEKLPINNANLVYSFQGLTDDNAWYVSAVFPVGAAGLPSSGLMDAGGAFLQGYDRYLSTTVERLEKLAARNYTPDLVLLEDIIRSLKISPG